MAALLRWKLISLMSKGKVKSLVIYVLNSTEQRVTSRKFLLKVQVLKSSELRARLRKGDHCQRVPLGVTLESLAL